MVVVQLQVGKENTHRRHAGNLTLRKKFTFDHGTSTKATHRNRSKNIQRKSILIKGAIEFLKQEYLICMIFVFIMFWVIYWLTPQAGYTAVAFLIGAIVSILSGTIGMIIATQANFRTTFCAKKSLADAFRTAYRAGCGMGFALVSLGLLGNVYKYFSPHYFN